MFTRIAAYTLFILGFLTWTFFRHYSGEIIPYPWLFWFLGLLMFLFGYLLLRYAPTGKEHAKIRQVRQLVADLKTNGEQIRVDFSACEILENNYTEQVEPYSGDDLMLATGRPSLHYLLNVLEDKDKRGDVEVNQSCILFRYQNNRTGQTEKFISHVIDKDSVTLSFYLDQQKKTTLYVDKTDRNLYYFDLAFLKS
jgi:hypothetical protein